MRLLTFETFDQSDEKTWPDQQKGNDKDNDKYFWEHLQWAILKHLTRVMRKHDPTNKKTKTMTLKNTFREHLQRAIFETFDIETFDQSDEKTWPDQKQNNEKGNDDDKYI